LSSSDDVTCNWPRNVCSNDGVDLLQSRGHVSQLISLATMMHAGRYSVLTTTKENTCILWLKARGCTAPRGKKERDKGERKRRTREERKKERDRRTLGRENRGRKSIRN